MADFKHWMGEAGYALGDPNIRAEVVSAFAALAQAEALNRIGDLLAEQLGLQQKWYLLARDGNMGTEVEAGHG